MNSRTSLLRIALLASLSGACIEIDGGAVELSWSVRSFDGTDVEACSDARVDEIRICWQAVSEGSGSCTSSEEFPCDEENGVSGFEIAPGETAFWVEPICVDGDPADPTTYQVPPPIVRTVEEGKIVTLNSLLIVVHPLDSSCSDIGCTCVRP